MHNFIDGKFVGTELYLDSYEPSVGRVWAYIPMSTKDDVDLAVAAAKTAFEK